MSNSHPTSCSITTALLFSTVVYIAPVGYLDFGERFWGLVLLSPKLPDSFAVAVRVSYICWTLLFQILLAVLLRLLFGFVTRRIFKAIIAVVLFVTVGIPLTVGAVWLDSRLVPALYRQSEGGALDWQEDCRMEHSYLLAPQNSRFAFLERTGQAWLIAHSAGGRQMPSLWGGCRTIAEQAPDGASELIERLTEGSFPVVSFNLISGVGLREKWFNSAIPSNDGKTFSDEVGFQFTPTSLLYRRSFSPGGCVSYDFSTK